LFSRCKKRSDGKTLKRPEGNVKKLLSAKFRYNKDDICEKRLGSFLLYEKIYFPTYLCCNCFTWEITKFQSLKRMPFLDWRVWQRFISLRIWSIICLVIFLISVEIQFL
jgi:hypothetical protein